MSVTGLIGSFPLTQKAIAQELRKPGPGVFTLGDTVDGKFKTLYVGRSDNNLKAELQKRVGQAPRFKYQLFDNAQSAFNKQCELFHFLRPKGNTAHPQGPPIKDWKCPECG